ncbi:MAG: Glucan 1,4-a-glucosidase, partial [Verrucomicrobiales bacterium]|nr:Glucan 1,4-a-glucosidase [Verrucomicrobiales bacterium]
MHANPAPGGPGVAPSWTRADKAGVGTALSWSSQVWFTIAGGVITEVYYPDVDTPQTRDLQFLVTDGSTFCHDPKVDCTHQCAPIDPDALAYTMTNKSITKPYTLTHDVICEPSSPCVLIRTRITGDASLLPKLRLFVLLAPHMEGAGWGNSGFVANTRRGTAMCAHSGNTWLAMGADCGFKTTGCGYVGVNDGWKDIIGHNRLPIWNYDSVFNGNIALTAEIDLAGKTEFVLAVAFSDGDDQTPTGALVTLTEALSNPFEAPVGAPLGTYSHLNAFLKGWKDRPTVFKPGAKATSDGGRLFNLSRNVLLAHEDKKYNGALVASLSTPWGEVLGDSDTGYHLVWPRDMSQSAMALLAAGETDLPLRG